MKTEISKNLVLRWLVGSIIGFISGILLIIGTFFIGFSGFGLIILGHYLVFQKITQTMFSSSFDAVTRYGLMLITSVFMYSTVWAVIGALLASGRKIQIISGIVLIIIYMIIGYWSLVKWSFNLPGFS